MRENQNVGIAAAAALLLVLMVLLFVTINPWMLYGVTAILWAIAGIVRAIRGNRVVLPNPDEPSTAASPPSGATRTRPRAANDGPNADPHEPVDPPHDNPPSDDTDHGDATANETATNEDS